jgi:hypothetical protein
MSDGIWRDQLVEMLGWINQQPCGGLCVGGIIDNLSEATRVFEVIMERYHLHLNSTEFLGCKQGTLWVGVTGLMVLPRGRFMLEMGFDFDPNGLFEGWMPRTILGRSNFSEIPELLPCHV